MRVIGTRRTGGSRAGGRACVPPAAVGRGAGRGRFRAAAPAGDGGDARVHEHRTAPADEARPRIFSTSAGASWSWTQDLIDAVKAGTIAGAVLDVFTTEPLPAEHPFWVTPGITVLPHIGGLHPGARPHRGPALGREPPALPRRAALCSRRWTARSATSPR